MSPYSGCWRPPDGGRAGPPIGFHILNEETIEELRPSAGRCLKVLARGGAPRFFGHDPQRAGAVRCQLAEDHRGQAPLWCLGCKNVRPKPAAAHVVP